MSKEIVLDCNFEYGFRGEYTCVVQNENLITLFDDRVITGIRGKHLEGKSNDDVTQFYAENKTVKFFPQNLTKYFKNIKSITIRNGQLQNITKEDLKEFGDKIEYLCLDLNEIEVLEADLFKFNRILQDIILSYNKIKRIEAKTFNGLEKLESLWLENNPCTLNYDRAFNNRQEVLELIKRLEANGYLKALMTEVIQEQEWERIWEGILEWNDRRNQPNQVLEVPCEIYASLSKDTNEPEIRGESRPNRLIMQLIPKTVISDVGGQMLRDARVVKFQWRNSEAFESLSKVMENGFAGCIHFTGYYNMKILILLYNQDKKCFYGFVPNDQSGYVEKLYRVIQQAKILLGENPGPTSQPG